MRQGLIQVPDGRFKDLLRLPQIGTECNNQKP